MGERINASCYRGISSVCSSPGIKPDTDCERRPRPCREHHSSSPLACGSARYPSLSPRPFRIREEIRIGRTHLRPFRTSDRKNERVSNTGHTYSLPRALAAHHSIHSRHRRHYTCVRSGLTRSDGRKDGLKNEVTGGIRPTKTLDCVPLMPL